MSQERKRKMTLDEIEAAALELPEEEIADLVDRLVQHRGVDPETEQRWKEELEQGLAGSNAGEAELVSVEETLSRLNRRVADDLASAAMQMPADERARLADQLMESVVGEYGYDPAYAAELKRRIAEIEAGTAKTISAEEVFAKLRARRHARSLSR